MPSPRLHAESVAAEWSSFWKTSSHDADLYYRWTQLREAAQDNLKLLGDDAMPPIGLKSLANVHGALRGSSNGAVALEPADQKSCGTDALRDHRSLIQASEKALQWPLQQIINLVHLQEKPSNGPEVEFDYENGSSFLTSKNKLRIS